MDVAARSPGAASWWRCPAIGTAPAEDRDDNCGCWPHRPRAGFHQPLGAVRVQPATDRQGNGASHLAAEQSLDPRSGQLSRAEPQLPVHIPVQDGPPVYAWVGEQEQTRSYARDQDAADDPAPGAGSTPIGW